MKAGRWAFHEKLIPSRRPGRMTCYLGAASIVVAILCVVLTALKIFFPLSFLVGVGALLIPLLYGITEWGNTGDFYERNLIKMGIFIGAFASMLYLFGIAFIVPVIG